MGILNLVYCYLFLFVSLAEIDTFKHKTDIYSNQTKLFSVHFQEMTGFKGKRKRGLTLTLCITQFVDLSRFQFTSDESEFITDYS
jgi:SUMO ligase MMS21 Smc5/6 complex component